MVRLHIWGRQFQTNREHRWNRRDALALSSLVKHDSYGREAIASMTVLDYSIVREDIMASDTIAEEPTRRDFLFIATGAMGAIGAAFAAWPLIDQMNPDATTLAAATTDIDISNIAEGQIITVKWRGKPIFISHRTPKEVQEAQAVSLSDLRDPATDESRVQKPEWLILVGICTHLGCVPLSNSGPFEGGYFCPCHGSVYDASGRIRQGPAPYNLALPPYKFVSDTKVTIG
jgi:ubiquinol-cytochrome c reductase iron-sulfur subunit